MHVKAVFIVMTALVSIAWRSQESRVLVFSKTAGYRHSSIEPGIGKESRFCSSGRVRFFTRLRGNPVIGPAVLRTVRLSEERLQQTRLSGVEAIPIDRVREIRARYGIPPR